MIQKFGKTTCWIGLLLVLVAVLPHFRSKAVGLSYDEADYALAARKGFVANWLDLDQARQRRHFHGPLAVHLTGLSTVVFGKTEFAVRIFGRFFGILTVLLIYAGCTRLCRSGVLTGAIAALLLAVMPTFVQVSFTSVMHSLAAFLIVICFFLCVLLLQQAKTVYLYLIAISIGLLLSTIEYGFVVAGTVGLVLLFNKNPYLYIQFKPFRITFSRHLFYAFFALVCMVMLIWPAGVLKLNLVRNLLYYFQYSQKGHPILFQGQLIKHLPWWAYMYWFKQISPVWLYIALAGLVTAMISFLKDRSNSFYRTLLIFMIVLLFALFKQHIMSARYAIYVLPFLSILGAIFLISLRRYHKIYGTVILILLLGVTLYTNWTTLKEYGQGVPGYKQAANWLRQNAEKDDRILTWYKPVLEFYLDGFENIYNYNSGNTSEKVMSLLKRGYFSYVIYYKNQRQRWPNDPGYEYITKHYNLVYVFEKENEEFLWLYAGSQVLE